MAKKRPHKRTHGVAQRIAKTEISREPGMYEPSAEALASAPSLEHLADLNHPNIFTSPIEGAFLPSMDRIKPSTYEYVVGARDDKLDPLGLHRSVADVLRGHGKSFEDPEIENILLDMEAKGLIEALPDGQMLVKGTREQLMQYGIDPTDKSIFDGTVDPPKFNAWRKANHDEVTDYITGYSKFGKDGDPDVVLCHNPDPKGKPMLFPRAVLAKARAAGETWIEYTEVEMRAWQASEGEKASVQFVLDYTPEGNVYTDKAGLDEAWQIENAKVTAVEARLGSLEQKAALAASSLLEATEGADTPGWTHDEIKTHLGVTEDRIERILGDMLKAGHLEVHTRENGEKAYRLNEAGREAALNNLPGGEFDEDDPRFMSKQWFNDLNTHRAYRR